jgi:hypothetical protein
MICRSSVDPVARGSRENDRGVDLYPNWCNLTSGVFDVEFVSHVDAFREVLRRADANSLATRM